MPLDKQLFFNLNIPIRAYLDYALPLSILSVDHRYMSLMFSYNIQTFFPDSMLGRGIIGQNKFMIRPSLNNWQWQKLGLLDVEQDDQYKSPSIALSEAIDGIADAVFAGFYVETRLDEYYLPCRPAAHQKNHNCHINLVTGVSFSRDKFWIAGYGDDYEVAPVSRDTFGSAFTQLPRNLFAPGAPPDARDHRRIWKWRPRSNAMYAEPDMQLMRGQIDDYIKGRSSHAMRVVATDDDLAYPVESGHWGLETYNSWEEYLGLRESLGDDLDLRAARTLWEHKRCMALRYEYLNQIGKLKDTRLKNGFGEVESYARKIRFAAFFFNRTKDKQYLTDIRHALQNVRQLEAELWRELLSLL